MNQPAHLGLARNGKAVLSLALGVTALILSPLLVGGLLGLGAAASGMMALRQGGRRGMASWGIATGILAMGVAIAVSLAIWFLPQMVAQRREKGAQDNLRQLAAAGRTYASANGG